MKRILKRAALALLVLVLFAPALPVGALALSDADPLLFARLGRADFEFDYVPPANSDYALYLFSADGGEVYAHGEILEDGEVIASGIGSGEICSAWLVEGRTYSVRVHGSGNAVVEMARNTLSRCYLNPLETREEESAEKMIARAFDAHWYRFEAQETGRLMLTCEPLDAQLQLSAMLFDGSGALISEFERLSGGACMLLADTVAGAEYHVRVFSPEGRQGYYALNLRRDGTGGISRALRFDAESYALSSGGAIQLSDALEGEALLWVSDDPEVAAVDRDGVVRGLRPGKANITAYGLSSQANCRVEVELVPLEGLEILSAHIELSVGDSVDVQIELTPEDASDRRLRFRVDDPEIVRATRQGVLRGLQPGETTLYVESADGALSDSVTVTVTAAVRKYRALLVGEQSYPFSENPVRNGSETSVSALRSLLESARFEDAAYAVHTHSDLSRAELIAEIRSTFADATEQDLSLLYVTCHGSYSGGMSFLELSDGSSLSARDLERELREIPGTVVVLIDCCGSGGAIGAASDGADFARGVTGAFSGAAIRGSKYKVLASAGLDQDSFRVAFNEDAQSGEMATVFVRALCDGAGWNLDQNVKGTMGADRNFDGEVTLNELHLYMTGRVNWYLGIASDLTGEDYRQSVQLYPEGDPLVIFERQE